MKAGTNMKIAQKTVYVFVLLAITMVTRLAEWNTVLGFGRDRVYFLHSGYYGAGFVLETVLTSQGCFEQRLLRAKALPDSHTTRNNTVLVTTVGNSSVLTCLIKGQISMLTWTITPKVGGPCTLVYRTDRNMTHRANCSDNINWKFRADLAPALEIQQVGIAQEGNYSCEVASTDGNFRTMYHLTVLVEEE
ncbi:hypothetical protein DUI87_17208 [Hirundo rustica rustica]|uniref:Ig-like domain-containing protein n=1 Tax=Hirundo rustica rustica TaxID=333673 RepID=A0A3M0K369_HIRRU|nr:hypothetical protein DUI87_17208 [Hirundo rustica rustica]